MTHTLRGLVHIEKQRIGEKLKRFEDTKWHIGGFSASGGNFSAFGVLVHRGHKLAHLGNLGKMHCLMKMMMYIASLVNRQINCLVIMLIWIEMIENPINDELITFLPKIENKEQIANNFALENKEQMIERTYDKFAFCDRK